MSGFEELNSLVKALTFFGSIAIDSPDFALVCRSLRQGGPLCSRNHPLRLGTLSGSRTRRFLSPLYLTIDRAASIRQEIIRSSGQPDVLAIPRPRNKTP